VDISVLTEVFSYIYLKLKENKSVLILQLDQIHSLSAAINTLEKINQKN
jgi:hypothetical protein